MTDRAKGFVVVLNRDYRDDDVEHLRQAILMLKGVVDVRLSISTPDDYINRKRIALEFRERLLDALREDD